MNRGVLKVFFAGCMQREALFWISHAPSFPAVGAAAEVAHTHPAVPTPFFLLGSVLAARSLSWAVWENCQIGKPLVLKSGREKAWAAALHSWLSRDSGAETTLGRSAMFLAFLAFSGGRTWPGSTLYNACHK